MTSLPKSERLVMTWRSNARGKLLAGKTPLGVTEKRLECVIVIGSCEIATRIAQTEPKRVVVFSSLQELDQWRAQQAADETFGPDIDGALSEIGCSIASLPTQLRWQLEAIGRRTQVPPMRELESGWPSRRSFYRAWKDAVHEPPSAFLRRARLRHAERLIALGRSKKEAAHLAGFNSPEQLRRHTKK